MIEGKATAAGNASRCPKTHAVHCHDLNPLVHTHAHSTGKHNGWDAVARPAPAGTGHCAFGRGAWRRESGLPAPRKLQRRAAGAFGRGLDGPAAVKSIDGWTTRCIDSADRLTDSSQSSPFDLGRHPSGTRGGRRRLRLLLKGPPRGTYVCMHAHTIRHGRPSPTDRTHEHHAPLNSRATTTSLWAVAGQSDPNGDGAPQSLPPWWGVRGGGAAATTTGEAAATTGSETQQQEEAPPRDMRIPITLVSGFLGALLLVCLPRRWDWGWPG